MAKSRMPQVEAWQQVAINTPVAWEGDLHDDCTAQWAGLTLRAEQMTRTHWWWAVFDQTTGNTLADSNGVTDIARTGKAARSAAEAAARKWLQDGKDA